MAKLKALLYAYFVYLFCTTGPSKIEAARITTANGVVEGTEFVTAEQQKTVYAFFSIPYAQPPVGNLRFKPPQPPSNWTGVRNATYERDVCVQIANQTQVIGSENCLFVNVFTTKLPTAAQNPLLPVMFWIHGGAYLIGSGNIEGQGPDYLLNDGVLVVTINYRLGLFGFLSTGDLASPGNNGMKDQVLALRWVKSNIARFGGDPNNVTIFGQSAGAASVSYLVQSDKTAGLFKGAIMESGTTLCIWALSRTSREFAFEVGRRLSILTNDSSQLVNRLRNTNYAAIQIASQTIVDQISFYIHIDGFDIGPVKEPEHPDAFFTSRSYELLNEGKFNRIPLLVGFNSEEGSAFVSAFLTLNAYFLLFDTSPQFLVPVDLNIVRQDEAKFVGRLIHSYYAGLTGSMYLNYTIFIPYYSDDLFTKSVRQYVKILSSYVPTFYYELTYKGNLGNPNRTASLGVGHFEDLNYIFWTSASDNASANDTLTRKRMVRLWTNFAKRGNPTPNADSLLQGITWPVASASRSLYFLNIGSNLVVDSNIQPVDIQFWDQIYSEYGKRPFDTY